MTFQDLGLIPGLSGLENVTFKFQDFPRSVLFCYVVLHFAKVIFPNINQNVFIIYDPRVPGTVIVCELPSCPAVGGVLPCRWCGFRWPRRRRRTWAPACREGGAGCRRCAARSRCSTACESRWPTLCRCSLRAPTLPRRRFNATTALLWWSIQWRWSVVN